VETIFPIRKNGTFMTGPKEKQTASTGHGSGNRCGIVPCLLLTMMLVVPAGSGSAGQDGIPEGPTRGVRVTRTVPFANESFGEIHASARNRIPPATLRRTVPFLGTSDPFAPSGRGTEPASVPAGATPLPQAPVVLLAPALDSGFPGLGNPPHNEGDVIPPNAMGAAGPAHLVTFLNSGFGVFSKDGAKLDNLSLRAFWGSLGSGPGEPAEFPYDTKVLYDPSSERFIVISLGGGVAPDSWILIAFSSSSDPLAPWNKWAIDADLDNNVQQFYNFADYPGVGVDGFNVYLSTNMYGNDRSWNYSKVWVLPKNQMLSANDNITWTEFRAPSGSSSSMQPAHAFGAAGEAYFLFEGPADSLGMVSQLQLARMDNTSGSPVWHPPTAVPVTPYARSFALPDAPQLGDSRGIFTADTRMQNVVLRNGSLWSTHHLAVNGKVEVAWYRINPGAGAMMTQGRISDPTRWYYFPSIGVNKDNVAAIGFSGSSVTEYAGAFYTIVRPASGAAEPVALLKAGEASYFKIFGAGTQNRWGDFSATVVDPSDDTTFWTLQEYAQTPDPVSGESRWGTWWGKFSSSAPSPSGGSGSGGGCLSITRSGSDALFGTSLFSVGILLLPACALGLRRFFRRRERTVPIRHLLC
jgi:hypothetical protein